MKIICSQNIGLFSEILQNCNAKFQDNNNRFHNMEIKIFF